MDGGNGVALEPATTYSWRVRAGAPVLSPWSAEQTFTTSLDTEAVTLKTDSPAAGADDVPLKPTFQWTAITGASAYELVVSTNEIFDKPSITRVGSYAIPTNAWQCDVNLDYLTTYYWHVRAVSQSTTGDWSATGIFTTKTAPGMPGSSIASYTPVQSTDLVLWSTGSSQHSWLTVTTDIRIQNLANYSDVAGGGTTNYTNTLAYSVVAL